MNYNNPSQNEQGVTFLEIINTILEGWKTIVIVTVLVLLGAIAFLLLGKPVYQVNAVIQIDQSSKGMSNQLAPIEAMLTGTLPSDGEIELIRSRSVVGTAVEKFHLEITTRVKRVFFLGSIAAILNKGKKEPVFPWLWMSSFGWGGEAIHIAGLTVPKYLLGEQLTLTTLEDNLFKLTTPDGKVLFKGSIGEQIKHGQYYIEVSSLRARPSTQFEVIVYDQYDTTVKLQQKIIIEELGRQSGVIKVSYNNTNPKLAVSIVNTIVSEYYRQNISRKAKEASKTLAFLSEYLPRSKDNLSEAEQALSDFQSSNDTISLELETRNLLERRVAIQSQLEQLSFERQDLRQRFSIQHPKISSLDNKIKELNKLVFEDSEKAQGLPVLQRRLLALTREVTVNTEMYTYLINRTQELQLMEAGTVGDIRIIDWAEKPFKPIFPVPSVVIAVATMLGIILGIVIVVVRLSFKHGVKTSEEIESATGDVVYAALPFSKSQEKLPKSDAHKLLAQEHPRDVAIEGLRNFVVNLHFTLLQNHKKSIAISGVSPGAGKSFISANLAYLLSEGGKRTLLVDADMRKGYLALTFNTQKKTGLSELLATQSDQEKYICKINDNLDLITTGHFPPNPIDLLMSTNFKELMQQWERDYDYVIVDTPPVLSVADATVISKQVGSTFLVIRAGENSIEDIKAASKRFENINQPIHGFILNCFEPDLLSAKGYGKYAYYGYAAYADDNK